MGALLGDLLSAFKDLRVLVLGDAMLDTYLSGPSGRLCPEAPVPVVAVSQVTELPGGAANVAANVAALGAQVSLVSVVGDDAEAKRLGLGLEALGVPARHLVRAPERRTLTKTRVSAGAHMLVRFDRGTTGPIGAAALERVLDFLGQLAETCDLIVVSDYGYGVMSREVVAALGAIQEHEPRVLAVDAKELAAYRRAGVTVVKPNYAHAARLIAADGGGPSPDGPGSRVEHILAHGQALLERCGAAIAAVTLDTDGAVLFEAGRAPYRTYARPNPQHHAAGAGDTFLTALGLSLAAGADLPRAGEVASAAAAVVTAKEGTATCSARELSELLSTAGKVLEPDCVPARMDFYRSQGRRIVFTNGCFDILHRGHTAYLSRAKALGDILVVGLNSDASVRRLKGPLRPVTALEDRAEVLSALSCVDHVVVFEEDDPRQVIRSVRPHLFVKGGDYGWEDLVEAPVIEELGGAVHILPYEANYSSSSVIERIRAQAGARP
jgi:D-beta-D-heptose 7-phosphate kinase/D-beta-D-heptose 1-phosphate adenosyltransferase